MSKKVMWIMSKKVIQAKGLGHVWLRGRWGGLRELMLPCVESSIPKRQRVGFLGS